MPQAIPPAMAERTTGCQNGTDARRIDLALVEPSLACVLLEAMISDAERKKRRVAFNPTNGTTRNRPHSREEIHPDLSPITGSSRGQFLILTNQEQTEQKATALWREASSCHHKDRGRLGNRVDHSVVAYDIAQDRNHPGPRADGISDREPVSHALETSRLVKRNHDSEQKRTSARAGQHDPEIVRNQVISKFCFGAFLLGSKLRLKPGNLAVRRRWKVPEKPFSKC